MVGNDKLKLALENVDWKVNLNSFFSDKSDPSGHLTVAASNIAQWAFQIEFAERENPAICFIREMQFSSLNASALIALGFYKPAAASMRSVVEAALYYTYFRNHPAELSTLVINSGYYIDKKAVIDFHKMHSVKFNLKQQKLGLIARLESWYSETSAIVHGQIPGVWTTYTSVGDIAYDKEVTGRAVKLFAEGGDVVARLFLCTLATEVWHAFTPNGRSRLLTGLPKDQKDVLALDPK